MEEKNSSIITFQNWLNTIFGGSAGWIPVEVDGATGTNLMQATVRAFQIEHAITPTGVLGPVTAECMKNLKPIIKMDPNDEPSVDVCLIQGALFAKGYNAGGITGIYYNTGIAAVKSMQSDAGLEETGIVDWKVWYGLLSLYWFEKVFGGDSNIQTIQRQLNTSYSDYIGVGPCDGIMQRHTALSLLAALQLETNVISKEWIEDLNELNFGPLTASAFPTLYQGGNKTKLNKILQYSLYVNGFDPQRFDGVYDATTSKAVSDFQSFAALKNLEGVVLGQVNHITMHSLLDSRGDPDRKARACDCATVLNRQQAIDLKTAGYTHVGRYLTGTVGNDFIPKFITYDEIDNIEAAGLSVFPIYQDGGWSLDYFKNPSQGFIDGMTAILAAKRIGIPNGTTIYFAVDFDAYGYQIMTFIIPYFKKLATAFKSDDNDKNYTLGAYGPRYICSQLCDKGWTKYSFVAGMSTKFACNIGYPLPKNWAFDQFHEFAGTQDSPAFPSNPSFPLDKVAYSGADIGITKFDKVPHKTDKELEKEIEEAKLENSRKEFIYNVLDPFNCLDSLIDLGISYDYKILLETFATDFATTEISTTISFALSQDKTNVKLDVNIDNSGELSTTFKKQVNDLCAEIELQDFDSNLFNVSQFEETVNKVAMSIKSGNISFSVKVESYNVCVFKITAEKEHLMDQSFEGTDSISVAVEVKITLHKNKFDDNKFQLEPELALAGLAVLAMFAFAPYLAPTIAPEAGLLIYQVMQSGAFIL